MPPKDENAKIPADDAANYGKGENKKEAHTGNKNYGVGGTSKDGGLSTADTVADGGPDDQEEDAEFKPT